MKKILSSEITPYSIYLNRRKFVKTASAFSIASLLSLSAKALHNKDSSKYITKLDENDELNTYEEITTYNNFYEFGMGKTDPSKHSDSFNPYPWSIKLEGLIKKPQIINLEKILSLVTIEDRVYRLRCVEAWSMVIPWQGFPLSKLVNIAEPLSAAKFIDP